MSKAFKELLTVGGKSNSLGRAGEVVASVLDDTSRVEELYQCMFHEDAWVRMRAADSFEKICRERSDIILPYIDRIQAELASSQQPSIQWHIAQLYEQLPLSGDQKHRAIDWLGKLLSSTDVDWIVAANTMRALARFTKQGDFPRDKLLALLNVQLRHKSNSVVKRARKTIQQVELT